MSWPAKLGQPLCVTCANYRTFIPRDDERERFSWTDTGHECTRHNWEGYTEPYHTCEAHSFNVPE